MDGNAAAVCQPRGIIAKGYTSGMTFSIVAHDPATQSWGVAVASKFLAVGAVVPFAQAGNGILNDATRAALNDYIGVENLEERIDLAQGTIDPPEAAFLKAKLLDSPMRG